MLLFFIANHCRMPMLLLFLFLANQTSSQNLYDPPTGATSHWISFENPSGEKGVGGKENQGAKGHAWDIIRAGKRDTLFDVKGTALIHRIWMTLSDRSPATLQNMIIEMYWENSKQPAVQVPVGDFFGIALGKKTAFQNALFSDPEGRSFNCFVQMPFKESGKIILLNNTKKDITVFYDIAFSRNIHLPAGFLYFHASHVINKTLQPQQDFLVLPKVSGRGRYLGANFGIITDSSYQKSWWGEGEIKIYIDGDHPYPSLVNSGTEDYIGTAYRQGAFSHLYQGCPVADVRTGTWCFYRFHIPDPIYFYKDIKVAIQQMGGDQLDKVRTYKKNGAALIPVSVTEAEYKKKYNLLEKKYPDIDDNRFPKGWVNFYRKDIYTATAYYYLDKP